MGPAIYRVGLASRQLELLAQLDYVGVEGSLWQWFGLSPDNSLLFFRNTSVEEVYALDVDFG